MALDPRILESLRFLKPFHSFSDDDLRVIAEFCAFRKMRTGETIFCQGEPSPYCFGVLSGEVALKRMTADGTPPAVLATYSAGQLFGEFSLLGELPRAGMASVTQDGELLSIWSSRFREWVERHRSLSGDPVVLSALRNALQHSPRL